MEVQETGFSLYGHFCAHIIPSISKSLKVWVKWSKMLGKRFVHNIISETSTIHQPEKPCRLHIELCFVQPTPSALNEFENKISVIPAYIPSTKIMRAPWLVYQWNKNQPQVVLTLAYHEPGKATRIDGKDLYGFDTILNVFERMSGDISLKEFLLCAHWSKRNIGKRIWESLCSKITISIRDENTLCSECCRCFVDIHRHTNYFFVALWRIWFTFFTWSSCWWNSSNYKRLLKQTFSTIVYKNEMTKISGIKSWQY